MKSKRIILFLCLTIGLALGIGQAFYTKTNGGPVYGFNNPDSANQLTMELSRCAAMSAQCGICPGKIIEEKCYESSQGFPFKIQKPLFFFSITNTNVYKLILNGALIVSVSVVIGIAINKLMKKK